MFQTDFFVQFHSQKTTFFLGILDVMSTGGLMVVVKKSLKAEVVYLGCPRKLGSIVSKKVVTLIDPIYKYIGYNPLILAIDPNFLGSK